MNQDEVRKLTGLRMAQEIQEEQEAELQLILDNMKQGIPLEDTVAALRLEEDMSRPWRKEQGEVFPEVRQPSEKERMIAELMLLIRTNFTRPGVPMEYLRQEIEGIAGPCEVQGLAHTVIIRRLQEEADGTHIEINIDF